MKKSKRRAVSCAAALMTVLLIAAALAGCSPERYEKLYDDDEWIAKNASSFVKMGSTESSSKSNEYTLTAGKYYGKETVKQSLSLTKDSSINVKLDFESGRFKLVLVKDGKVYLVTDEKTPGDSPKTFKPELEAGKYDLKIVGANAWRLKLAVSW